MKAAAIFLAVALSLSAQTVVPGDLVVTGKVSVNAGHQPAVGGDFYGPNYFWTGPVLVGDGPRTSGIALGVRQTTATMTEHGQRGISSGPMFSHAADIYAAAFVAQASFEAGTYTTPKVYAGMKIDAISKPAGVTIGTLYGIHIEAMIHGQKNYAIWTDAGKISFGETVTVRNGGFKGTLGGALGTPATWNMSALAVNGYYVSNGGQAPMVDLSGEWVTNMDVVGIKLSIKDTFSGANAKLMELRGGSTGDATKFSVEKDGTAVAAGDVIAGGAIVPSGGSADWTSGANSPEGVHAKTVGSLYSRTGSAAGPRLYVKENGAGATGWIAK